MLTSRYIVPFLRGYTRYRFLHAFAALRILAVISMSDRVSKALAEGFLPGEGRAYDTISRRKKVPLSTFHHHSRGRHTRASSKPMAVTAVYSSILTTTTILSHLLYVKSGAGKQPNLSRTFKAYLGVINSDLRLENFLLHGGPAESLDIWLCDFGGSSCENIKPNGTQLPDSVFFDPREEWVATITKDIFSLGWISYFIETVH